ncbi:hypothetical protein [Enterobacter phage ZX14]
MSLYDPIGSSDDGVIDLIREDPKASKAMDATVESFKSMPGAILISQGPDRIVLDASQVENLYSILKHNR